jgi:hypothetical protein
MRIPWLEKAGRVLGAVVGVVMSVRCDALGHRWWRIPEYLGAPPRTWECRVCGKRVLSSGRPER